MDFSTISLTKRELQILRRAEKGTVSTQDNSRLLRLKFLEELREGKPGYMPQPTGEAEITQLGIDYLRYRTSQDRQSRVNSIRYWITTAIALAAFIKSFFFN